MEIVEYYEVTYNSDQVEGKGRILSTGIFFKKEEDAIKFVGSNFYKKYACMGYVDPKSQFNKYNVRKVVGYVFNDFEECSSEYGNMEKEQAKAKVLAKLTPAERNALGFE